MQHVFVYGTLLFPEILEGLTGRSFPMQKAELKDFKRRQVLQGDYPAIVEAKGESVTGKLIVNIDARSLEMLRFYEGDDYDCQKLEISVEEKSVQALVFVWKHDANMLTEPDWDAEFFKRNFLQDYLKYVIPDTVAEFTKLFS